MDKWGVPVETYALNHYPIYVPGSSYVVTMDIVAGNLNLISLIRAQAFWEMRWRRFWAVVESLRSVLADNSLLFLRAT